MLFYKWNDSDFVPVTAHILKEGDEIAYGHRGRKKYGVVISAPNAVLHPWLQQELTEIENWN